MLRAAARRGVVAHGQVAKKHIQEETASSAGEEARRGQTSRIVSPITSE
jgi:hypothetical protein